MDFQRSRRAHYHTTDKPLCLVRGSNSKGPGRATAGSWQVADAGRGGGEVRIGLAGREPGEEGRLWVCLPRATAAPDVFGSAAAGQPGPTRAGDGVWIVPVVTAPGGTSLCLRWYV